MNNRSRTAQARIVLAAIGVMSTLAAALADAAPPETVGQPSATQPSPAGARPAPAEPATTPSYVIGPGDTIQVFVWRNPELSVTVPVRPDGKVSTPLVEDMVAVGKTPTELARDIEVVLAEFIRSPQVNIIVNQAASALNQIRVIGQVKAPQAVAFREGMTLLDVMLQVGGLTEFAAGNRGRLIRKDEHGKEVVQRVRLHDLITEGQMSENVPVKPGDVVIVPESIF